MTGFARVRKIVEDTEIVLTLKSVNHRGLDLHFHIPSSLDPLENDIRGIVKAGVSRGHVQINLSLVRVGADTAGLNRALLALYMNAFREAAELYQVTDQQPDLNAALRIPGMLGMGGEDAEIGKELSKAILETVSEAVSALNAVR